MNSFTKMVPSGQNGQVTPTGTIPCLVSVCFRGGKTKSHVIGRKTQIITTQAVANDNRRQTAQVRPCAAIRRWSERLVGRKRLPTCEKLNGKSTP